MLEAPHEGIWGVTLHTSWFSRIADAGFQSVRIPVRWSAHTSTQPPYEVSEAIFRRVEWAIEQANSAGLAAIVNVHHYDELYQDPEAHADRLVEIWKQVATRLRRTPSTVVYELLNEPHAELNPSAWRELLPRLHAAVREVDQNRVLLLGPAQYNSVENLETMWLPEEDRRIIATIHFYQPFRFTHQGASWVDGSRDWVGTSWAGTKEERDAIEDTLRRAKEWGEANNIPINLGEFGAYSRAAMESRVRWTRAVREIAEEMGMSWHYWEFASSFGIFDPETREWREELKAALIPPKEEDGD